MIGPKSESAMRHVLFFGAVAHLIGMVTWVPLSVTVLLEVAGRDDLAASIVIAYDELPRLVGVPPLAVLVLIVPGIPLYWVAQSVAVVWLRRQGQMTPAAFRTRGVACLYILCWVATWYLGVAAGEDGAETILDHCALALCFVLPIVGAASSILAIRDFRRTRDERQTTVTAFQ